MRTLRLYCKLDILAIAFLQHNAIIETDSSQNKNKTFNQWSISFENDSTDIFETTASFTIRIGFFCTYIVNANAHIFNLNTTYNSNAV